MEWYEEASKEIATKKEEWMKEKGYKPALKLEEGMTEVDIDISKEPREIDTQHGKKWVVELVSPAENSLICSSMLYEMLVQVITETKDGKMNIMRTGAGKATRYVVKPVKE